VENPQKVGVMLSDAVFAGREEVWREARRWLKK
jgi:hypothetical protein